MDEDGDLLDYDLAEVRVSQAILRQARRKVLVADAGKLARRAPMRIARIAGGIDPLVRLLLLAMVLATVVPVTGPYRPLAQMVSNGAIFLLFLLNGLRLPREDVLRGIGSIL